MLVELPNGFIDGPDHFNFVEVDELRGKQQNYLANQELVVGNIGHIPKILEDMILSLQTKEGLSWKGEVSKLIWKLPIGDLQTILVKIRENTYGGKFYHGAVCEHCQHEMSNLLLKLQDLKISKISVEEMLADKKVKLPKSKMEAELKPNYLRDLFSMIKITTDKQDQLVTELAALSIKALKTGNKKDSKVVSPITGDHLEELPVSDLLLLQQELEKIKLEGTIDTDIEIDCSNCHKEFSIQLNVFDPSFFDPTKGSIPGTM